MTRRWYLPLLPALAALALLAPVGTAAAAHASLSATCRSGCVDLSVSVSDGVSSLVPGGATVYLVTVRNAGPSSVTSLTLTDATSVAFRNVVFAPTSGSYKASTHLWSGVSLASGGSATMLVAGMIDPAATGTLVNTVTLAPPAGTTDMNAANNTATDTDTLAPLADLSVGLSDGVTSLVAGRSTVYTVTVRNNGLSTVGSLLLTDTLPSSLTGAAFAPASGSYSPATHVWSGLSLAAGQSVSMTVSGTVGPAATASLVNTLTVAPPAGVTDPITGNNTATDTDALKAQADLSISNSDGATTAVPGGSTTYSIVVSNTGPSSVTAAAVKDTPSGAVASDSWSGPNGTSGTGAINTTVNLPAGGSATYTVVASVSASATGSLQNTATVTAPAGVTDPNTGNNGATDSDTLTPQADLAVSNDDGATAAVPGGTNVYAIVVSNAGPSTATAAEVVDTLPAGIDSASWTGPNGTSGTGSLNTTVTLLPGSSATYTLTAVIDNSATGPLADTATVTAPVGVTDPNPTNNTATDTDSIGACSPRGTNGCPWAPGDFITYAPSEWAGDSTATDLLAKFFYTVYDGSGGVMVVGDLPTALIFDGPKALYDYLPACGPPAALAVQLLDPGCDTESGVFGGDVTALKLNVDFYDAGDLTGAAGLKFGDLTLCNLPTAGNAYPTYDADLHALNGTTVRQFLAIVSAALSGEPSAYTPAELDPLLQSVDASFTTGVNTVASSYLYNGDCP